MAVENLSPKCAACGEPALKITLESLPDGVRFVFASVGGTNGAGDRISEERAARLRVALAPPVTEEKLAPVGLARHSGFCRGCAAFYCASHWGSRASAGAGTCPHGHFESLDPHWSPED